MGGEKLWAPDSQAALKEATRREREIRATTVSTQLSACDPSPFRGSKHHHYLLMPRLHSKPSNHWKAPGAGHLSHL